MSTASTSPERPWHVSEAHLRPASGGAQPPRPAATPSRRKTGGVPALRPLWYRLVTGKSLLWRVNRLGNRAHAARRRLARRTLRWLDIHPEVRHAASIGAFGQLSAALFRRRPKFRTRRAVPSRPRIVIDADLTVDPTAQAVLSGVDLLGRTDVAATAGERPPTRPVITVTGSEGEFLTVTSAVAEVGPLLPPVDLHCWNPSRFMSQPTSGPVRLTNLAAGNGERAVRRRLTTAQQAVAVECIVDPAIAPASTARTIVELAAAGVPLVGSLSESTADLIGPQLAELIRCADLADLDDAIGRELHSLRIRRAAWDRHSVRGWWQSIASVVALDVHATPAVSVLLPSNRPDDVVAAARLVAAQVGVDVQLVVGLHGSHMPATLERQLADAFAGPLVVRRLADDLNLGQVMNELTAFADRDLVSKWDDDDWYDASHLADLAWAMEYSGASMVGKAAEFVYLEALDLTIRRFATGSERMSTTVAGGTLMLGRDDLDQVGWADAPRQVDRLLIDALEARGRPTYRIHGFGYVLRRRGAAAAQHTWLAGDDYFLRQSVDQRPGLDLEFAGFSNTGATTGAGA